MRDAIMDVKSNPDPGSAVRPVVLISRCITFDHCRWNGDMIASPYVEKMKRYVDFMPVCAEMAVGLGVPRKPVRLVVVKGEIRMVQHETGDDVTARMNAFSERYVSGLRSVDGMVLKERSPSCGFSNVKIYCGTEGSSMMCRKGAGLFAAVCRNRFPQVPFASEGHLYNFNLREHFYTQIFTLARLRALDPGKGVGPLVDFHASHKLLLMGYHQTSMRAMGRIVANHERRSAEKVYDAYYALLCQALARPARSASLVNVLMHAMGYFSNRLSGNEKRLFLGLLEQYRKKKLPLSSCSAVIRSWISRFEEEYLGTQYFFSPFPEGLVELSDSGKG
ncbi:MAG: DUF523 and DUF1722 domain-containing protein [Chitinispirillaceae bacterium]|nr:DUF523 and DUF1722 domain-containing protein [Chitinispirillaceae bacterium]